MQTLNDARLVAPALEKYAQDTLLGDVWKRPGLGSRDRSIITVAALIARCLVPASSVAVRAATVVASPSPRTFCPSAGLTVGHFPVGLGNSF